MKKKILLSIICILFVAILILIALALINQKELTELKNKPFNLPKNFTYTAHTGCVDTEDNSLESIEIGAKYGAHIVEFDLNFLKDGTAVLAHDEPKGNEITLDLAFKKVSEYENLKVNVDAKSVANLKEVVNLAEKHGISDRIFYTGISKEDVETVKKYSPEVPYYLNVDVENSKKQTPEYLQSLVDEVKGCGAIGINFNKDNATKELVDIFHENDLLVSIWTVNEEKKMYEILHLAPDNITTRNPDKMNMIFN